MKGFVVVKKKEIKMQFSHKPKCLTQRELCTDRGLRRLEFVVKGRKRVQERDLRELN